MPQNDPLRLRASGAVGPAPLRRGCIGSPGCQILRIVVSSFTHVARGRRVLLVAVLRLELTLAALWLVGQPSRARRTPGTMCGHTTGWLARGGALRRVFGAWWLRSLLPVYDPFPRGAAFVRWLDAGHIIFPRWLRNRQRRRFVPPTACLSRLGAVEWPVLPRPQHSCFESALQVPG